MSRLFVTGATGFVGRRFLACLPAGAFDEVACLTRDAGRADLAGSAIDLVEGDLLEPGRWDAALEGSDAVVHLAAATGSAPARRHWRVNARGTELLLHRCEAAGVRRFVHVSTVATRFDRVGDYPYAASKRKGEEAVLASGLAWTVVRPSLIAGSGGAWRTLVALARLPVIPLPGPRGTRVRPVWVDDVARVLVEAAVDGRWTGEVVDLGGPERLTIADLLTRIRRVSGRGDPVIVPVPVAPLLPVLAWLDRRGAPLPVTAGPLRSLREDDPGVPGDRGDEALAATPLDAMIERTVDAA